MKHVAEKQAFDGPVGIPVVHFAEPLVALIIMAMPLITSVTALLSDDDERSVMTGGCPEKTSRHVGHFPRNV